MKRWTCDIQGKEVHGLVEKVQGVLWVHLNGKTFSFSPETKQFGSDGGGSSKNPGNITAPMPGKIVKLGCKVGAPVNKGDVLVSMEAMKMEYSLKAARDGVVKIVNCQSGDQVNLGDVLVELEAIDE